MKWVSTYTNPKAWSSEYGNAKIWLSEYGNPKVWSSEYLDMVVWYMWLRSLFDYLWVGQIIGNDLISDTDGRKIAITGKDFTTTYIPAISVATFTLPGDADFIADDLDAFWFTGSVPNSKTAAELADPMLARTLILYNNDIPFDVYAIGILRSTITLTDTQRNQLGSDFKLWLFYSETI